MTHLKIGNGRIRPIVARKRSDMAHLENRDRLDMTILKNRVRSDPNSNPNPNPQLLSSDTAKRGSPVISNYLVLRLRCDTALHSPSYCPLGTRGPDQEYTQGVYTNGEGVVLSRWLMVLLRCDTGEIEVGPVQAYPMSRK